MSTNLVLLKVVGSAACALLNNWYCVFPLGMFQRARSRESSSSLEWHSRMNDRWAKEKKGHMSTKANAVKNEPQLPWLQNKSFEILQRFHFSNGP